MAHMYTAEYTQGQHVQYQLFSITELVIAELSCVWLHERRHQQVSRGQLNSGEGCCVWLVATYAGCS